MSPDSARVTLHIWRTPAHALPRVLWRLARDRGRLRRADGVGFAKLLGTAKGRRFGPGHADLTRWAALVVGDGGAQIHQEWGALASSYCRLDLATITARGQWAGREPFPAPVQTPRKEPPTQPHAGPHTQPVLALTRARLRASQVVAFWRAIDPVAAAATTAPGLLASFGIGEAPVGWQGTISLWRTAHDLVEFAYRHPDHRRAIERTPTQRWYAEELFARFAVLSVTGDRDVIGWTGDEVGGTGDEKEEPL